MEDDIGQSSSNERAPKKRRSFTIDKKLEVVEYAKGTSRNAASRKYGIARHCVSQWMKTEKELEELSASTSDNPAKKRRPGAGRQVKNAELDDKLADWVRSEILAKRQLMRNQIQEKALEMYAAEQEGNFKASSGWFEKFLLRHNLHSCRYKGISNNSPSTSTFLESKSDDVKKQSLGSLIRRIKEQSGCDHVYVAYQSVMSINSFGKLYVGVDDEREVPYKPTDEDKIQIGVVLTARSDGLKLPPFVILPDDSKNSSAVSTFDEKLHLHWAAENVNLDEKVLVDYLERILEKDPNNRKLVLWNKFGCQMDDSLNEFLKKERIDNMLIPTACRGLKAVDLTIGDAFTTQLQSHHQNWITDGESETVYNGNLGPLSMNLFLTWVYQSWSTISKESIDNLFKTESSADIDVQNDDNGSFEFTEHLNHLASSDFLDKILKEAAQELADDNGLRSFIKDQVDWLK